MGGPLCLQLHDYFRSFLPFEHSELLLLEGVLLGNRLFLLRGHNVLMRLDVGYHLLLLVAVGVVGRVL